MFPGRDMVLRSVEMNSLLVERPQQLQEIILVTHSRTLLCESSLILQDLAHLFTDELCNLASLLARCSVLKRCFNASVGLLLEEVRDIVIVHVHDLVGG